MWKRHPILTTFATLSLLAAFAAFFLEFDRNVRPADRAVPVIGDAQFQTRPDGFWLTRHDELHDSAIQYALRSGTNRWRRRGVQFEIEHFADGYVAWQLGVSFWWLFLLLVLPALCLPAIDARAKRGALKARRQGQCERCGYDLQGSGGKCPECGAKRGM